MSPKYIFYFVQNKETRFWKSIGHSKVKKERNQERIRRNILQSPKKSIDIMIGKTDQKKKKTPLTGQKAFKFIEKSCLL